MSDGTINLPMTDVDPEADERVFSEAELATIGDLVMWHHLRQLPAHKLVRIPGNRWSVWGNMPLVAEARRKDDTRDWYFPISVSNWYSESEESEKFIPPDECFTWSGIWHPTEKAVSTKVRRLPPTTWMLEDWQRASFPLCEVVASEGGLLLIKSRPEVVPVRRSRRANRYQAYSAPSGPPRRRGRGHSNDSRADWTRLLVCNPMTRECKELPEAKCTDMGWKSWQEIYGHGMRGVHMEVKDEANSYQVILILLNFVAVYKSTTDNWNCVRFEVSSPWSCTGAGCSATALVGRHLYAVDVQSACIRDRAEVDAVEQEGALVCVGTLRFFHADIEACRWMLVQELRLRWFHMPSLDPYPDSHGVPWRFLEEVELVRCMGSWYAIIPSLLQNVLSIGEKPINSLDFEFLMKQNKNKCTEVFNLVRLEGEDEENVLLRIPDRTGYEKNGGGAILNHRIYRTWIGKSASWGDKWFTCKVRGSVIWVFFRESLLSFDVVSRKLVVRYLHSEQTQRSTIRMSEWSPFSYRPNFYMKP